MKTIDAVLARRLKAYVEDGRFPNAVLRDGTTIGRIKRLEYVDAGELLEMETDDNSHMRAAVWFARPADIMAIYIRTTGE